jgi:hypothetical protein
MRTLLHPSSGRTPPSGALRVTKIQGLAPPPDGSTLNSDG